MEKEVRFRILNKTPKTVTLKLQGKPMTFSWEEFNKKLIVVDKVWAILNEEEKKKQEEADDLVNDAVVCVMLQRGNADPIRKLSALAQLGTITEKLQVMLECTPAEVMNIIRQRLMLLNPFMVNPMFDEPKPLHRTHTEPKRDSNGNREVVAAEEKRPTFGDAFSSLAELKEKLSK